MYEQLNILSNKNIILKNCVEILENDDFIKDFDLIYKIGVLSDIFFISKNSIKSNVENALFSNISILENITLKKIIESAFIFSSIDYSLTDNLSEEEIESIDDIKNKAYIIAISVYYYGIFLKQKGDEQNVFFNNNNIIYALFTRLGILTDSRNNIKDKDIFSLDIYLKIEASIKESQNKFSFDEYLKIKKLKFNDYKIDKQIYFSDFQKIVFEKLLNGESTIISAPTSAGKSFIIKTFIQLKTLEFILENKNKNFIYIVPSKSLINEVKNDFVNNFKFYGIKQDKLSIHSHISGEEFIKNYKNKNINIFIFTQERLNYFYNDIKNLDNNFKFDYIFIDEAHKVGYGYRGTLLSYIIQEIRKDNLYSQICLLAPLSKKLNKFEKEFNLSSTEYTKCFSNFGLVSKNIILVQNIKIPKSMKYKINFYLSRIEEKNFLFSYEYDVEEYLKEYDYKNNKTQFMFDNTKYLSVIPLLFGGKNIVYQFGREKVIEQSEIISLGLEDKKNNSLNDFEKYLKDVLPENFPLIKHIKNGVVFHNGILPQNAKELIEEDFKKIDGNIDYLCANHTILEGVNLSAKNIFIGSHDLKKISKLDIKNLIGRSGRLNFHLSGNVFFIIPNAYTDKILEKIPSYNGFTEDIIGNMENLFINLEDKEKALKINRFIKYISLDYRYNHISPIGYIFGNGVYSQYNTISERKDFEYLLGFIINKKLNGDNSYLSKIGEFIYEDKVNKLLQIEKNVNYIYNVISKLDLEFQKIIKRNLFVDPRKVIDFINNINNNIVIFKDKFNKYATLTNDIYKKDEENLNLIKQLFKDSIFFFVNKENELKWEYINKNHKESKDYINSILSNFLLEENLNILKDYLYNNKVSNLELIKDIIPDFNIIDFNKHISNLKDIHLIKITPGEIRYKKDGELIVNTDFTINLGISWLKSIPLREILTNEKYYIDNLVKLQDTLLFSYLNSLNIYLDIMNTYFEKYLKLGKKIDDNLLYYLEIGSYYPNVVYLISKGVSRESAIYLFKNKIIEAFSEEGEKSEKYFIDNKENIYKILDEKNKFRIKNELEKFIY